MTKKLRTLVLVGAGLGLAWMAYDPCYCSWSRDTSLHPTSLPKGCAVFRFPAPWVFPADRALGEVFEPECRQPLGRKDEVFISLRSRARADYYDVKPRNVKQKFGFRLPALVGDLESSLTGVRAVSDDEWNAAVPMPATTDNRSKEGGFVVDPTAGVNSVDESPLSYGGKSFAKTDQYWAFPALLSPGKRRIALFSYGRARLSGSAGIDRDFLTPPWRTYAIDFFDTSGTHLSSIRAWSCSGGYFFGAQWHGDQLFMMGTGNGETLVCGFKWAQRAKR